MNNYTYEKQGGIYRILKNDKPVSTPKGAAVVTDNEALIQRLVKELNAGKKHTSSASLLCYHYTYCDLAKEYSQQAIAKDMCAYCKTGLEEDEFLMFLQTSQAPAVLKYFKMHLPNLLRQYNMNQLVAIMVILVSFDSMLLSHHIINEVVSQTSADKSNYADLKSDFLLKVKSYYATDGSNPEEDEEISALIRLISETIDAFEYYYTL